jgi:hypothetical protein
VRVRPPLLIAILLYITLDLSLPAMPGAFVFDAGDSVESVQRHGGRAAVDAIATPRAVEARLGVAPPAPPRVAVVAPPAPGRRPPPRRAARSALASPPLSDDAH